MAQNAYITALELRGRLDIDGSTKDEILDSIAEGISRAIDQNMRRRFYVTSSDETRYYTAMDSEVIYPGDIVSITTLKTDDGGDGTFENTWTTDDYILEPMNAALDNEPYTAIYTATLGDYKFPVGVRKGVQIVGKFGYPAIPANVKEAALLLAERLYKRKDAIFGVVGSGELGEMLYILRNDPEIRDLLYGMTRGGGYL